MSPDVEWRVGETGDQEIIARVGPPAPPRWRKWALIAVVLTGLGLGIAYTSIPEPLRPAPTPQPTVNSGATGVAPPVATVAAPQPQPLSLNAAIERDALALADHAGDDDFDLRLTGIDTIADEDRASWYYDLLSASGRWGRDGDPLFKIDATGALPDGTTWVELQQARHGVNYKQTRFYRLENQGWQMRLPSRAFWGGQFRAINTLDVSPTLTSPLISFELLYPVEDEALVPLVAGRFSRAFMYLCVELACPITDAPSLARGQPIALTVSIRATAPYAVRDTGDTISVTIPSPRVTGYYDVPEMKGDPIESMAFDSLLAPAARLAAGYAAHWPREHQGELLLNAIIDWLRVRASDEYALSPLFVRPTRHGPVSSALRLSDTPASVYYAQLFESKGWVPLEELWRWPPANTAFSSLTGQAEDEAEALIAYLDQRFGSDSVIRFLHMLGTAESLPDAIERGLVINYSYFVIGWEQWIGKRH